MGCCSHTVHTTHKDNAQLGVQNEQEKEEEDPSKSGGHSWAPIGMTSNPRVWLEISFSRKKCTYVERDHLEWCSLFNLQMKKKVREALENIEYANGFACPDNKVWSTLSGYSWRHEPSNLISIQWQTAIFGIWKPTVTRTAKVDARIGAYVTESESLFCTAEHTSLHFRQCLCVGWLVEGKEGAIWHPSLIVRSWWEWRHFAVLRQEDFMKNPRVIPSWVLVCIIVLIMAILGPKWGFGWLGRWWSSAVRFSFFFLVGPTGKCFDRECFPAALISLFFHLERWFMCSMSL